MYSVNGKSYLEVQCVDTGTGIKRAEKSKLFKLFGFVQANQAANNRGIGLGLVISKKIVESFGGMIGFKSKWQKGSTFGFTLCLENNLPLTPMKPSDYRDSDHEEYNLTDNENNEADLDLMLYVNPELQAKKN